MAQFEYLGVIPEIIQATEDMDWTLPTTVQDEAIPLILGGGDVMVAAETGSGKTGAFAIPVIQIIYETLHGTGGTTEAKEVAAVPVASAIQWDSRDRDEFFAISPDGYTCQTRNESAWGGARANVGFVKGKLFFEGTCEDEGLSRIGWSTGQAKLELGSDALSFGYGGTAKKSNNKKFDDYGEKFIKGDTVGCYIDLDARTISYSKNGVFLGTAFTIPVSLNSQPFYPAVLLKNAQMTVNFGRSPFKYPPNHMGYKGVAQANDGDVYSTPKPVKVARVKVHGKGPLALIIEPTQELASQVDAEISKFTSHLQHPRVTHILAAGNSNFGQVKSSLLEGVHIVTGTIGMIKSLLQSHSLDPSNILYLVLDEADQLLDQGNKPDIMHIYNKLPTTDPRFQVVVCSATLHTPGIAELTNTICKNPQWVDLKGKDAVPDLVDHAFILVDPLQDKSYERDSKGYQHDYVHHNTPKTGDSKEAVSYGIKMLKPLVLLELIDAFKMEQCMVFCRTRVDCEHLEAFLNKRGGGGGFSGKVESGKENPYSCCVLHGGKGSDREKSLEAFKDGDVRFLICTDVAARGIDVKELPFVINMTLPDPIESYIHRIGRVGRAGCPGLAISICAAAEEKVWWHTCDRQDRGVGCRNNELTTKKGCTIWYSEATLKKQIEERLSKGREEVMTIPYLDRSNLTKGRELVQTMAKQAGGTDKSAKLLAQSSEHVDILKPSVNQLATLEIQAQQNYLRLVNGGIFTGTPAKKARG